MPWLQLKLRTSPQRAEAIATLLSEAGAAAVTLQDAGDQPLYEPSPGREPLWEQTEVTGLFAAETDMDALLIQLQQQSDGQFDNWQIQELEEREWTRTWMDGFHSMQFGRRLWICPGWHQPPDEGAINITLDPGLAFGTGTHPTTALCLEWLDAHPPTGRYVIDYGCGSGILAIAALKLGARKAQAIDHEPQALQATRSNARKNDVRDRIACHLPDALRPAPCDLLLANILANPLIELAPRFSRLVSPGGSILLSGILIEQTELVAKACYPWFSIHESGQREGWALLEGVREQ